MAIVKEVYTNNGNCPCASFSPTQTRPPSFIANNYYCESAAFYKPHYNIYFFNNTLWDGAGCIGGTCCDDTTQPWFYCQLDQTTQDDIEARIAMCIWLFLSKIPFV